MGIEEIIKKEAFRQGEVYGKAEGREEGREEGKAEEKAIAAAREKQRLKSIAEAMLEDGFPEEKIMKLLNVEQDFLMEVKKSMENK